MSSSTSDSSDDETNLELLREATDQQFINDSMFKNFDKAKKQTSKIEPAIKNLPPSLRPDKTTDNIDYESNVFKTTPEFRTYVSKQLGKILDEHLEYTESSKILDNSERTQEKKLKKKKKKGGIKLLANSSDYIYENNSEQPKVGKEENCKLNTVKRPEIKRRILDDYLDDQVTDEEKCKLVAVSPDDVLGKTETEFWSNRSKAPVYKYKKTKSGLLIEET